MEPTIDWTWPVIQTLLPVLIGYLIFFFVSYFIIKMAIRAAMADQTKQAIIKNRLLAEQLRSQGVSEERINELLDVD